MRYEEDEQLQRPRRRKGRRRKRKRKNAGALVLLTGAGLLLFYFVFLFGQLLIPASDQETTTFSPAVSEEELEEETEAIPSLSYLVCIDAGHGGKDPGCSADGYDYTEAEDNLAIALLVAEKLEAAGCSVLLTRSTDVFLSLSERTAIANEAGADVLVSLHRNAISGYSYVQGVEIWIGSSVPEDAYQLASSLLSAIEDVGGMKSRGISSGTSDGDGDYAINSQSNMASCIVELGYMSNTSDNEAFHDLMEEYAQAIADGILSYLESTAS